MADTNGALQKTVDALEAERDHSEGSNAHHSPDDQELPVDGDDYTIKAVSLEAAHYSGEFSHWSFSKTIRDNVDRRLQESAATVAGHENDVVEYWRASHLRSSGGTLQFIIKDLPPKDIAVFLTRTYFSHAQTNTLFVEESWVVDRVHRLYTAQPSIGEEDAPWICTALLVLAVGTQFAHLESGPLAFESLSLDDDYRERAVEAVGVSLYQKATRLMPDVLTIASVESVRAFLLLAHYALPLDAQGLAYSYLGIAMKVAIQNGMHRQCNNLDFDPSALSLRLDLWKTVFSLERRISILHGRPASISCMEVDAESVLTLLARSTEAVTMEDEIWLAQGEVRQSLAQGINLICLMASANASTRSEASVLVSLDAAIKRFSGRRDADDPQGAAGKVGSELKPYDNFTCWALGLQDASYGAQDLRWLQSPRAGSLANDSATVDSSEWPSATNLWDGEAQSLLNIDELFDFAFPK
ncbi:hypothetical protein LTR08_001617 [Meristemomyces frigidus]|nr:hypothetical protein LTR08_001617 [Meristemomyces frigidus]